MRPIPARMAHLPRDRRGYPVFYIALIDTEGTPHFTINDASKVYRCHAEGLCSICGSKLGSNIWFVGGPLSAFHPEGAYNDPPMHKDCALYALQVCPYLSHARWGLKSIAGATLDPAKAPGVALIETTMMPGQPPVFILAKARGVVVQNNSGDPLMPDFKCKPRGDWLALEGWRHGQQLDEPAMLERVEEAFKAFAAEKRPEGVGIAGR